MAHILAPGMDLAGFSKGDSDVGQPSSPQHDQGQRAGRGI